jgi:tetratricopeptide (TPR) repeat protein
VNRLGVGALIALTVVGAAQQPARQGRRPTAAITVDYPLDGSVFPPEFPPPTFLWRDADKSAATWVIEVSFADASAPIRVKSRGPQLRIGEIDPRCVGPTNRPPRLTPEQAAARTWTPDAETWGAIKKRSTERPATVTVTGYGGQNPNQAISRGQLRIRTSPDPVGAPIFYRDVPLMPSELEKGVIKPLATSALPLIAWRLRYVGETKSQVMMEGLHTCANCHSVSRDGKTLGLDVDGPQNDKGLYAVVPIQPRMSIGSENIVTWSTFRGKLGGKLRVGFMSQVSPEGRYVVTTINDPGEGQPDYERKLYPKDLVLNYYVANFKDYRFLQVFYPTRGILAWYSRETGRLQPLPGADDPRYVHTNAVWSPDGQYLVFARSEAKDAYAPNEKMAAFANDPGETQIRYDLYRIPFNGGQGGLSEPIAGASQNGMSNSFPKVSPDGKWIVFVQCRNGQLMRPDSKLYIVPVAGGQARLMRANTPLMNSWHSFSPNGRWLVFSSKSRTPYTQMFLTHIDEEGNDSPAILIENATAANRAVNIPEFINIPPGGMLRIDTPVADYYRVVDLATESLKKRQYPVAIDEWRKAVELGPTEALPRNNLGVSLVESGKVEEAIPHYRKALELNPEYPEAHNNLGVALVKAGKPEEALPHYQRALELNPNLANAHNNLGVLLAQADKLDEAIPHFQRALEVKPDPEDAREAHFNLGLALVSQRNWNGAMPHFEEADRLSAGRDPTVLDLLAGIYSEIGRFQDAVKAARRALTIASGQNNQEMVEALKARIALYESRTPLSRAR